MQACQVTPISLFVTLTHKKLRFLHESMLLNVSYYCILIFSPSFIPKQGVEPCAIKIKNVAWFRFVVLTGNPMLINPALCGFLHQTI